MVLAAMVAVALQLGLGVDRVTIIYFAAVLFCAGWLGGSYGLLVTPLAVVVVEAGLQGWRFPPALGSRQDLVNLVVFATGALAVGAYRQDARVRWAALSNFPVPVPGLQPPVRRWRQFERETWGVVQALLLAGLAGGVSLVALELGVQRVSALYVAAVVVAAIRLGVRFALVAAIASLVAFDYIVLEPRFTLQLDSSQALLNLVMFVGVGWLVGAFADRARREREAVQAMFGASSSFSATADEAGLVVLLGQAVRSTTGGGYVRIEDADGAVLHEAGVLAPGASLASLHSRPLASENGRYGRVCWSAARRWGLNDDLVRRTVETLADLASTAIGRARLGAELGELETRAEAERLRRALLVSISHDIRNPLATILGSASSLVDYEAIHPREVRSDLAANIREQALRLARYVENLLGMVRLEAGAIQAAIGPHPLEPLVLEAWQLVNGGAAPGRLRTTFAEPLIAQVDPTLFQHAIGNILENAVRYGGENSDVEVRATCEGATTEIVVRDWGPGVDARVLSRLFDPFFRAGGEDGRGVGLGLHVARSFTRAMRGEIFARAPNDGGAGLEIVLQLPSGERG